MKIIIQYIGNPKIDLIDLLVYYEVPVGQRELVKQKLREHFQRTQDEIEQVKEKVNELVVIVKKDNKDWSVKKICDYIAGRNDDLEEYGFSSRTIYRYINEENRKLLEDTGRPTNKMLQNNVTEERFDNCQTNITEDSSRMNAREFTKQHYQIAHRNMSKSEVDKIFEEIPQDVDFDHITSTDLTAALTNANESVIKKDFEEAETRLKRFDILMKTAEKDKKNRAEETRTHQGQEQKHSV